MKQYVTISAKQLQVNKRKQGNYKVIVRITACTIYFLLAALEMDKYTTKDNTKNSVNTLRKINVINKKCLIIILFKLGDNGAFYIVVMLT